MAEGRPPDLVFFRHPILIFQLFVDISREIIKLSIFIRIKKTSGLKPDVHKFKP